MRVQPKEPSGGVIGRWQTKEFRIATRRGAYDVFGVPFLVRGFGTYYFEVEARKKKPRSPGGCSRRCRFGSSGTRILWRPRAGLPRGCGDEPVRVQSYLTNEVLGVREGRPVPTEARCRDEEGIRDRVREPAEGGDLGIEAGAHCKHRPLRARAPTRA